jgi:hypothetical protein
LKQDHPARIHAKGSGQEHNPCGGAYARNGRGGKGGGGCRRSCCASAAAAPCAKGGAKGHLLAR